MNFANFGMDSITLAGSLETKLAAIGAAGFSQVMLNAADIVGHPDGEAAAIEAVRQSGLRVTGYQVLRDFEGLDGRLHDYKVSIAQAMLETCRALGSRVLLACSSASPHASGDPDALVRDLRKLAMLAVPLGIRVAYEALSWGRHVSELPRAWEIVAEADRANLGIGIDSFHILAANTRIEALAAIDPSKIFLVQLADFLWRETPSREERIETARHFRVFPGEGVHGDEVMQVVRTLDAMGYRGDYSFEVFNDDYRQLPQRVVAERARLAVKWISGRVTRRSLPARRIQRPPAPPAADGRRSG